MTKVFRNTTFRDLRGLMAELNALIAGQTSSRALDEALPVEDALALAYRLLLARAPDPLGVAAYGADPDMRRPGAIASLVMSGEEFLAALPFHLDRLRRDTSAPVTWHIHLPRTGGTKFASDWRAREGVVMQDRPSAELNSKPYWHHIVVQMGAFADAMMSHRPALVSGHFSLPHFDRYVRPHDLIVATIRDPLKRALSMFRYVRAMSRGGEAIIGYQGTPQMLAYYSMEWRTAVTNLGLSPDDLTLEQFVVNGICPDGTIARHLAYDSEIDDIAEFVTHAGIAVLDPDWGVESRQGEAPINRTRETNDIATDYEGYTFLAEYFPKDSRHYQQMAHLIRSSADILPERT